MRRLAYCLLLVACSDPAVGTYPETGVGGTGDVETSTGGATLATVPASTVVTAAGGSTATVTSAPKATGGAPQTATSATGGRSSVATTTVATGGSVATGGTTATGGAAVTGGSSAVGGSKATGGTTAAQVCSPTFTQMLYAPSVWTYGTLGMCEGTSTESETGGSTVSVYALRKARQNERISNAPGCSRVTTLSRDGLERWCRTVEASESDFSAYVPGAMEITQDFWLITETWKNTNGCPVCGDKWAP